MKTLMAAGDGTTAAIVLSRNIASRRGFIPASRMEKRESMETQPAKALWVAGKWITPVYIVLSIYLLIGLQGYGGDEMRLFYLHVASTVLAVVTYPLILYGLNRHYKPKISLLFSALLLAAYPATFILLAKPPGLEGLSVPLFVVVPPLLYLSGWLVGGRGEQPIS